MAPKKSKPEVQDRTQTTLEKWLSPPKPKKTQNSTEKPAQYVEKKQQSKPKNNKDNNQQAEQPRPKSKKAVKKPKKAETEEPTQHKMEVEQPQPEEPKAKTPYKKQPKTIKATQSKKTEKMDIEVEKKQNKVFKANDPKYSLLFADDDPLSDTEYIFDKTRPESLIISRKAAEAMEDQQSNKRPDSIGKSSEGTKQKKKVPKPTKQKIEKDKNS